MSDSIKATYTGKVIVDDLLMVVRLDRGNVTLEFEETSPRQLLVEALARHRIAARAKRISLIEPRDCHTIIYVDVVLFARVLDHILENALRYTPVGGRIAASIRHGDMTELSIANSGPAIPVELRERIFEKFAQAPAPSASPGRTGLGLYLCRRIVETHGGQILVSQAPSYPVVFNILLPINHSGVIRVPNSER